MKYGKMDGCSETIQFESGDPIEIKGYWSSIDRREGDDWKIRLLTVNVTPVPEK
jgi:hypothetical protein